MNFSFTQEQLNELRSQLEEIIQKKVSENESVEIQEQEQQQLISGLPSLISSVSGTVPLILNSVISGAVGSLNILAGGLINVLNSLLGIVGGSVLNETNNELSPALANLIQKTVPTGQNKLTK
ncbi:MULTISPECIES: hypothetical protein [Thermoactinomyces]|jgi:hypothetical protein|uniref:Uncharacterized protein n=1 Tax=Thermoactinomyces daqus TaxID=1329516 RepID=A0A7W1XCG2_9BACL|nr:MULTISPECIES: hypothetical protein [Thermoactinomyces]MBA4544076.1 hypothetical protein [Thermoactinomyces daqus]MBH8598211.1 hypothetical protein [Thermoactinomyces sp. CICC 10523]MBH8603240.1 hypothetical protein [Thermoactinomyces sp. CICC 10522]MBH8608604.1 hypothetical protein [Thermoactinomyces sp. CICC 10521]